MTELNGTVSASFEPVRVAVEGQLRSDTEVGLSLVVDVDGQQVVNLWGGHRDATRTQPSHRDTITNVWSITKAVTSLAALMLVDAGELDVYAPVARYWPEFAANGKQHVEVRHLLSHTSGISGLDHPAQLEDLYDVRATAARMASQAPCWEPGSASDYHVLNYGHLVGELVYRLTSLSLRDFVHQHIAQPLGADFQIGLRGAELVCPAAAAYKTQLAGRAAMAKLFTTEPAQFVVDALCRRSTARGRQRGHLLEHLYREVRAPRIYEGASEIQRTIIARELYR